MGSAAPPVHSVQYAALPWRRVDGVIEILLVTTLKTRRWIIPKGWPVADRTPGESAAHEALEEAGIEGETAAEPMGTFHYGKRRKTGEIVPCKVHVFAMEVTHQRRNWAEKTSRQTCWVTLEGAMARVKEPGLRRLIAKFAKTSQATPARRVSQRAAGARA